MARYFLLLLVLLVLVTGCTSRQVRNTQKVTQYYIEQGYTEDNFTERFQFRSYLANKQYPGRNLYKYSNGALKIPYQPHIWRYDKEGWPMSLNMATDKPLIFGGCPTALSFFYLDRRQDGSMGYDSFYPTKGVAEFYPVNIEYGYVRQVLNAGYPKGLTEIDGLINNGFYFLIVSAYINGKIRTYLYPGLINPLEQRGGRIEFVATSGWQ